MCLHLFNLSKRILNSNDKTHTCDYQNNSCPRALRAVFENKAEEGRKLSRQGPEMGNRGRLEDAQAERGGGCCAL